MARSLTVEHEEHVTTSPLLTGFLIFAVFWLAIAGIVAGSAEADADAPVDAVTE